MEFLQQPWTWYVAGILIGLTVPALLLMGNKQFGISSTLQHICAACMPSKIQYFNYDWRNEKWSLFFVGGIVIGGVIATTVLQNPEPINVAPQTKADLMALGITDFKGLLPTDLFNFQSLFTVRGFIFMVVGGFFVGFGTRYAGGCTSGHAITGLANMQWASLVATICFMVGGFLATHFLLPMLLG
jgi:uncharacterized membrane protein YedE/YeeE